MPGVDVAGGLIGSRRRRAPLRVLALGIMLATSPALAVGRDATPAAADATAAAASEALVADGFRSAKFGMTEKQVREAIKADFGLAGDAVVEGTNAAERTQLLTVNVPNLLPEGGTAQVSYVLGYASKALIQIGISWNAAIDPTVDAAKLYANSDVLVSYFTAAGYQPASVRTGLVLDNGILLFRGEDSAGHATILLLQGDFSGGDGQRVLQPSGLALLYAADSEEPDIFKIAPGQF